MKLWENHGGTGQGHVGTQLLGTAGSLHRCPRVQCCPPVAEQCLESLPLGGLRVFQCYLVTTGGLRAPSSPLCLSHLVPPSCFSFLPGAAVVLLQSRGDPAVTSRSNLAAASTPEKGPCGQLAPSLFWSAGNDPQAFQRSGWEGKGGDTKPNDLMNEE